jgi:hypothetical protein
MDVEKKLEYKPFLKWAKPYVINGLTTTQEVNDFYTKGLQLLTEAKGITGSTQTIAMADTGVNSHCMFADGAKISNFIPYSENPKVQDLKTSGNSKILYYVQGRKMKLPLNHHLKFF